MSSLKQALARRLAQADPETPPLVQPLIDAAQHHNEETPELQDVHAESRQVNACTVCKQVVTGACLIQDCGHAMHKTCYDAIVALKRAGCPACGTLATTHAQATAVGGYTLETSGNVQRRAKIMDALEHYYAEVRQSKLLTTTRHAPELTHAENVSAFGTVTYGTVPRAPGGPVPIAAGAQVKSVVSSLWSRTNKEPTRLTPLPECTRPDCGGPRYCVHRYLPSLNTRAITDWRLYAAPYPVRDGMGNHAAAAETIARLLQLHASPQDLLRCGAGPAQLAVCGITLADLVTGSNYLLEDLITAWNLTWPDLHMLNFHARMLAHRDDYPVIILMKAGLTARRLCEFRLTYSDLVHSFLLTQEEIAALGFTAPDLVQLGLDAADVLEAIDSVQHIGGHQWYLSTFQFTLPILTNLPIPPATRHDPTAYTRLLHWGRAAAPKPPAVAKETG